MYKHSAAHTAVEQSADCSPVFKLLRRLIQEMQLLLPCHSVIVDRLNQALDILESGDAQGRVLKLASHKKRQYLVPYQNYQLQWLKSLPMKI